MESHAPPEFEIPALVAAPRRSYRAWYADRAALEQRDSKADAHERYDALRAAGWLTKDEQANLVVQQLATAAEDNDGVTRVTAIRRDGLCI